MNFSKCLFLCVFCVFIFGFYKSSYSQRVTYKDLKYVLYHNLDDNEDYLLKKGFTFSGISDFENGVSDYNYAKNSKTSKDFLSISKTFNNNISYKASFYTVSKNDYILLKSQAKELGFIFKTKQRDNQSIIYEFGQGNLILSFCVTYMSEYGFPDYYIYLVDRTLRNKTEEEKR